MTRDQIAAKIQTNLNDAGVLYTADDLNDSLQDGYSEVAAFTGCIYKVASIDLVANLSYYDFGSLISDFFAVTAIFNTNTKQWLSPTNLKVLESIREDWELAVGNPFLFWPVNFRFVALYPRMTSALGSLYVVYRAQADVLTASSEPAIPLEQQAILENYTTSDLLEQAEEFTKAQLEFNTYVQAIKDLRQANSNFRLPDFEPRLA